MEQIHYQDFTKTSINVGTVIDAKEFPEARTPAIKLWIDFGDEIGIKKTSAQITKHYTPQNIIGQQLCAVTNFPPKQIGKFMSECLVLGFPDSNNDTILIKPGQPVPNGGGGETLLEKQNLQ